MQSLTFILIALTTTIGITFLIHLFLIPQENRKRGLSYFFVLYFLHFIFWFYSPSIESIPIKCTEYFIYFVTVFLLLNYFFEGKTIVNFTFVFAVDSIMQAAITCVMAFKAGSLHWYQSEVMNRWYDELSPYTLFYMLYAITIAFFICYILIALYKKHNSRLAYLFISVIAGCHILAEAVKCTENLLAIAPVIILFLALGILTQGKKISRNEADEQYYHILERKQRLRHEELCKIRLELTKNIESPDTMQSELIEQEVLRRANYKVQTGLPLIDCLFDDKEHLCLNKGIELSGCCCDLSSSIISQIDWVYLLSSLIDNAIESCEQVKTFKQISYHMERQDMVLYFSISFPCFIKKSQSDLSALSIYSSQEDHALQMVHRLTRKYKGSISFQNNTGQSTIIVTLKAWL